MIFVWLVSCLLISAFPTRAQAGNPSLEPTALFRDTIAAPLSAANLTSILVSAPPAEPSQTAHTVPVMKGCKAQHLGDRALFFAGGWSHCAGGRLSLAEQRIKTIDYEYDRLNAAAYAMAADPRAVMAAPLSASAGVSVPMSGKAHIGLEYSYTYSPDAAPFHFGMDGGPADEMIGHSATLRLGLAL